MHSLIGLAKTYLAILVLLQCATSYCQSLGDIARFYRANRPAKKAVRVYTVDDFYPGDAPKPKPPMRFYSGSSSTSSTSASEVTSSSTVQSSSGYTASASNVSSSSSSSTSSESSSSWTPTESFHPSHERQWCPPHRPEHHPDYRPDPPKPPPIAVKHYY